MASTPRVPLSVRAQGAVVGLLGRLPAAVRARMAGPEIVVDDARLAVDARLLIRSLGAGKSALVVDDSPELSRAALDRNAPVLRAGRRPSRAVVTSDVRLRGPQGPLEATLYAPTSAGGRSGALVFFHGGGWVIGSRAGYDHVCRFLAERTGHRVLSVDYRLAPEDPFPAAVDDALAAFDDAVARADELDVDPDRIVVGGDSAGATLAAVAARRAADRADGPVPTGQWLLYPATDLAARHPSRDRFGRGFLLTDEDVVWFQDHYAPSGVDRTDPLVSVLYGTVAAATPPAHLVTAGFDPLRDEGERYAEKLRAAGVPVEAVREADLPHGFLPFVHLGPRFGEAVTASAEALRRMLD
ncbi:alpha/beta hydrolase [Umezawaea tangerina]|uniref:Acetyl esterase n=1 Tax=Umezawaea tangerina TaxID=84725 RepID=A0A2T0T6P9_9PSEU|nr:alpha/beta hydrolase [Umezawaea tangerina]PRY41325.1 acetyl esterase [Umezawaea tangerina]